MKRETKLRLARLYNEVRGHLAKDVRPYVAVNQADYLTAIRVIRAKLQTARTNLANTSPNNLQPYWRLRGKIAALEEVLVLFDELEDP